MIVVIMIVLIINISIDKPRADPAKTNKYPHQNQ
jgi:hypothetical protein